MSVLAWLATHHVLSVLLGVVTFGFAASVVGQRRPTGSALAWLLVLLLVPYLGIPLYLAFGGRKFRRLARSKSPLALPTPMAPTSATAVEWLDDGVVAYEAFLREIQRARRTIRIVTFVLGNDATGRRLLEALTAQASAGLEVCLLLDDLLRFHAPKDLLAKLVHAGGHVVRFMPLIHVPFRGRSNLRNHRKIAIFDGERAIVGGMNLADEYMGPKESQARWRDLSTVIGGEAVDRLDMIFRADWEFASKKRLASARQAPSEPGDVSLSVVPSGPDAPNDPIYESILTALFRAERRFWISTPYFVPDEPLLRALSVAAHRGVDVRIVVPALSNHLLADLVGAPSLRELAGDGVHVHCHRTMLHAKALLVDDRLAVVGSANFDMRSLFLDYEVALFFNGEAEIARLALWFDRTLDRADAGPSIAGPIRRQVESIARLVAPLL